MTTAEAIARARMLVESTHPYVVPEMQAMLRRLADVAEAAEAVRADQTIVTASMYAIHADKAHALATALAALGDAS